MTTPPASPSGRTPPRPQASLPRPEEREWTHTIWEVTDAGVLAITLNRPEHHNALTFPLIRELLALLQDVAPRREVRAVTLRGAGTRAFCSGDDLRGMDRTAGLDNAHTGHHQLVMTIRELPKPVIALLTGHALGAGFELSLACDIRIAADNLDIGDHRVRRAIGMIAGSSWFLPRVIGRGRALEMLLTGRHLTAAEALNWGLVTAVWPLAEFDARAAEYVAGIAALPTIAASAFKAALDYGELHGLRDSLAHETWVSTRNAGTEDAAEGRASFFERREPTFRGR
ncbi:MAG: enoyl-CoA hydratase [Chloroflexi bacterium]|nr:enoyl-CoA hydratase [Chloroflexota bacterium]